jgi:hypothetical protein
MVTPLPVLMPRSMTSEPCLISGCGDRIREPRSAADEACSALVLTCRLRTGREPGDISSPGPWQPSRRCARGFRGTDLRRGRASAPGLTLAIEELWPRADRQHCAVHRLRNLQAKLPKSEHDRVRLAYWKALNEATGVKDGKLRLQVLISELEHAGYESAARCLADDLDALVVHLRYPLRHRNRWRSTNLLERSLGEVRRRTKVIGRFPGETSCLSLVWAVLDLFFSHASNGATFTDLDRQQLVESGLNVVAKLVKHRDSDPSGCWRH